MSTINIIAAMQSSILAATGKSSAPKIATAQTEPAANSSSATISQAARDALAETVANATQQSSIPAGGSPAFQQAMAEKFAGGKAIKSMIQSDPSNPMWTGQVESWAQHDFTLGHDVGYDYSGTKPGEPGRFLGGEPVTAESKAYMTQQTASYQNQLRDMISSEKAKGTAPSDILLKIFDQQGEQPARFRAMMAWPIAADFASSQPDVASGGVKS